MRKAYERRLLLLEKIRELKIRTKCKCGESHIATLSFHHRDGSTKECDIRTIVVKGWSWKRVLEEISKCDVMCENCHRKLHWEERNAG